MTDPFTILAGIALALVIVAGIGVYLYIKEGRTKHKR